VTRYTTHEVPGCGWVETRSADEDAAYRDVWQRNVYQLGRSELEGTVVLDVGSNVGYFTAFALYHGAHFVVAVDPMQEHHDRAAKMLGHDGRVHFVTAAAGDGCARVLGPGVGPSQTTLRAVVDRHGYVMDWRPAVEGTTLDRLLAHFGHDRPIIVKVDCEGCEFDLIEAASDEALQRVARFAMEWHGQMGAVRESAAGKMGRMVERLIYTHSVTVFGDPNHGGMLYAYRY